jgi:hypothetical protein
MKKLWEEPVQSVPVDEAMLRSAEQNALPWKVSSAEQNDPMRWKAYSVSMRYSSDPLIQAAFEDEARRAKGQMTAALDEMLWGPRRPPVPPTRLERVRSWLGWKLWRLAARLEPNVVD